MRRALVVVTGLLALFCAAPAGASPALVLGARGLGGVALGAPAATLTASLTRALGAPPVVARTPDEATCGVTRTETWGALTVDVRGATFVGYSDGPGGRAVAARTSRGLRVGASLAAARALYPGLATSFAQGGSYRVGTSAGALSGFLSAEPSARHPTVASIGAGVQGCPAMTP